MRLGGVRMDKVGIEEKIRELIVEMRDIYKWDFIDDEAIENTPKRIVKMLDEFYERRFEQGNLEKEFESDYDGLVIVKDIDFWAICNHHFIPFYGKAHVGYFVRDKKKVMGVSKLARIVQLFANQPAIQEEMTDRIADYIMEHYDVDGVMVVIEGEHMCMKVRGVRSQNSKMITSAVRGEFEVNKSLKEEFLRLIGR